MSKRLVIVAALAAITAVPASAAFVVTGGTIGPIAGNNDFRPQLNGLGQFQLNEGGLITLTGPASITFEFLGAESGFTDTFFAGGLSFTENNENAFGAPLTIGTATFAAGLLDAHFESSGGVSPSNPGMRSFGVFLPSGAGEGYSSNVLYLGFDDQINDIDDNHDDLIVRATLTEVDVPAPAALALFGLGVAALGIARRR